MGAGGSADPMKFSDVLILAGIAVLCAGFIIHGWVDSAELNSEDNPPRLSRSFDTLKGDEIIIAIEAIVGTNGNISITADSLLIHEERLNLSDGEIFGYEYEADSFGSVEIEIELETGSAVIDVDIARVFMLDFVVYPIGAAMLLLGLQKRREKLSDDATSAD